MWNTWSGIRDAPGQDMRAQNAIGIDITPMAATFTIPHFRGEECNRTSNLWVGSQGGGELFFSEPKVGEETFQLGGQEHVVGLHISVDDSSLVKVRQCRDDIRQKDDEQRDRRGPEVDEELRQGTGCSKLHANQRIALTNASSIAMDKAIDLQEMVRGATIHEKNLVLDCAKFALAMAVVDSFDRHQRLARTTSNKDFRKAPFPDLGRGKQNALQWNH
jgi:hypothetical protein